MSTLLPVSRIELFVSELGHSYRIGPFGFLASQELDSKGNFGFKDQICAYEWVGRAVSVSKFSTNMLTIFVRFRGMPQVLEEMHSKLQLWENLQGLVSDDW